jgi:hypothetical protein
MGTEILQPNSLPLVTQSVSPHHVCGLMSGSRFLL